MNLDSKLQKAVAILKQVFDHSFQPVLVTDPGHTGPFLIVYANPAFCQLTGYHEEEIIGKSPSIFQGKRSNQYTLGQLRQELLNNGTYTGASWNYKSNGEAYPVQWNISPFYLDDEDKASGRPTLYCSVQSDLTKFWELTSKIKKQTNSFSNFVYKSLAIAKQQAIVSINSSHSEEQASESAENLGFDDAELDEFLFFDDEEAVAESAVESLSPLSATEFLIDAPVDIDVIEACQEFIFKVESDLTFMMMSTNSEERFRKRTQISADLARLGNEFSYLIEFDDISQAISSIAVHMEEKIDKDVPEVALSALFEFIQEINTWFTSVFVDQTAKNVFEQRKSIIASSQQFISFFR